MGALQGLSTEHSIFIFPLSSRAGAGRGVAGRELEGESIVKMKVLFSRSLMARIRRFCY